MFVFSSKTYDFLKRLVTVILPAFGAAYFALANIWGLPAAENVVGTIAVVTTFLGVCLGISSNAYDKLDSSYDGALVVTNKDDGGRLFSLDVHTDPDEMQKFGSIRLKVKDGTESVS